MLIQLLAVIKWEVVRYFAPASTELLNHQCYFSPIFYFSNMIIFEVRILQKFLSDFFIESS